MKKIYIVLISFFMVQVFFFPGEGNASSVIKRTVSELTQGADAIIVGRVLDVNSQWNSLGEHIFTYNIIAVEEYIKAPIGEYKYEVVIRTFGGKVGSLGELVDSEPIFKKDERILLFLKKDTEGVRFLKKGDRTGDYFVWGLIQGKYVIDENDQVFHRDLREYIPLIQLINEIKAYSGN